jgi:hypothetical protein
MTREDPQMKLRLPEEMRDRIAEQAKANNRSMNSEIVARLESSFTGGDQSALITAIAHLNLRLAQTEYEKGRLELSTTMLANHVLSAARLIQATPSSDEKLIQVAKDLADRAKPHVDRFDALKAELQASIDSVLKAGEEIAKVGPLVPLDLTADLQPSQPPKRRVRVRPDPQE